MPIQVATSSQLYSNISGNRIYERFFESFVYKRHNHRHGNMGTGIWSRRCVKGSRRSSGQEMALDPPFERLLCMIGKSPAVLRAGSTARANEACIAHRKSLREQGVLATFTCFWAKVTGIRRHWSERLDETRKARTLCFVGDLHKEQCVVLDDATLGPHQVGPSDLQGEGQGRSEVLRLPYTM